MELTEDEVRKALIAAKDRCGMPAVEAMMAPFGSKRTNEIPKEKWPELYRLANELKPNA